MKRKPSGLPFAAALVLSLLFHLALLYGLPRPERTSSRHLSGTFLEINLGSETRAPGFPEKEAPSSPQKVSSLPPKTSRKLTSTLNKQEEKKPKNPPKKPAEKRPVLRKTSPPKPPLFEKSKPSSPGSQASLARKKPPDPSSFRNARAKPQKVAETKPSSPERPSRLAKKQGTQKRPGTQIPGKELRKAALSQSQTPSPKGPSSAVFDAEAQNFYLALLLSRISAHRYYPRLARLRGYEGRVVLVLTIGASGKLVEVKVLEGSGHPVLDRAALRMVRRAAPFPPPPPQLAPFPRQFTIPIRFDLTSP